MSSVSSSLNSSKNLSTTSGSCSRFVLLYVTHLCIKFRTSFFKKELLDFMWGRVTSNLDGSLQMPMSFSPGPPSGVCFQDAFKICGIGWMRKNDVRFTISMLSCKLDLQLQFYSGGLPAGFWIWHVHVRVRKEAIVVTGCFGFTDRLVVERFTVLACGVSNACLVLTLSPI